MYLTRESIDTLHSIILTLNTLEDEESQTQFLDQHTEDTAFLLETLKSLNKGKLPRKHKAMATPSEPAAGHYSEEELDRIFGGMDTEDILQTYSLADLKDMYCSAYHRNATSRYKKLDIIRTLRNWHFAKRRGDAFARMADARKKKGCNL
ncbi:hypothetical protein AALA82_15045 [Oscillospiraceae bacterium 50-16]